MMLVKLAKYKNKSQMYRSYGFEVLDIPDHIAVELEFLAMLTLIHYKSEDAKNDYLKVIRHLKWWAPSFFEKVRQCDSTPFYGHIASFSKDYLKQFTS